LSSWLSRVGLHLSRKYLLNSKLSKLTLILPYHPFPLKLTPFWVPLWSPASVHHLLYSLRLYWIYQIFLNCLSPRSLLTMNLLLRVWLIYPWMDLLYRYWVRCFLLGYGVVYLYGPYFLQLDMHPRVSALSRFKRSWPLALSAS